MLGDLNGDRRWTADDEQRLAAFLADPYAFSTATARLVDLNQNGFIDTEDGEVLRALVAAQGDPYRAELDHPAGAFPRPRELYRYVSLSEYQVRPLWALPVAFAGDSPLRFLTPLGLELGVKTPRYADGLRAALGDEAVRLERSLRRRRSTLLPMEQTYLTAKLERARALAEGNAPYELLLALMELNEDAETLTVENLDEFTVKLLGFRDRLRDVLGSPEYAALAAGRGDAKPVLRLIEGHLKTELNLTYDFDTLGPARDFTNLENYLQRAEWQYFKSTAGNDDFRALVTFAQHDARYLRAVSRTSRKLADPRVENHNLPMVLLFREALRLVDGDKKKASGLLDEALRIPFAWVKAIPRTALPNSVALENFLLPGNMEDGADKSRHWNVFGGICLYKSPREALDLALRREVKDLREDQFTEPAMREFLRDMIANLNGMFHVMAVHLESERDAGAERRE